MIYKAVIKILIFLLMPCIGLAQLTLNNPEGGVLQLTTINRSLDSNETEGSPYLEPEFMAGTIYVNGRVTMERPIRYNAYKSEIEIFVTDQSYAPLFKRSYITAEVNNRIYQILPYTTQNGVQRVDYFNPLNEGKMVLLFKPETKLKQGRVPDTSYGRRVPPTFIDISSYYLKNGDAPAEKIRLNKKDILNALDADKQMLQNYISENDLNLRKAKDVISLLAYYNTL